MKKIRGIGKNSYISKVIRAMNKKLAPPKLAGVGTKGMHRRRGV